MNNQNFYLRLIALLLIIMAVFFYNGTVKDKEQTQDIADLTAKVESLRISRTRFLQHYRKLMKNRKQQQKVKLLLMPLQKLIINPKRILQIIRKIQTRQILKKPMTLTMYIRMAPSKVQEQDTVERSLFR